MSHACLAPLTRRRDGRRHHRIAALLALALVSITCVDCLAADPADKRSAVVDGSAVLTVGNLHLNITNWGLIGSRYSIPSNYSDAPSAQWPGGTGHEYLDAAGLWVGGIKNGVISVSCAQPASEFAPPQGAENVMYEMRGRAIVRPPGPLQIVGTPGDLPDGDDDRDGRVDEDWPDGRDQDGDGLIDEDYAQRGAQMFSCLLRDDEGVTTQLNPDHRPLGIRVRQEACAWDEPGAENIIGLRFTITNVTNVPIEDLYVGFLVDCDIGRHDDPNTGMNDLAGVFNGLVRQIEDYFEDFQYGWMRDAAASDALPGWFGYTIDGSGFGDRDAVRPEQFGVNALRIIRLQYAGNFTGLPLHDSERYQMLARPGRDPDVAPQYNDNYALLLSVGPYERLEVGEHIIVDVGMTVAPSAIDLQQAMRHVRELSSGRWYNADGQWSSSGWGGRESLVCAEDFGTPWSDPGNPIYRKFPGYWDESCRPAGIIGFPYDLQDMEWYPELGKHCVWVSMDNCDECTRYYGYECVGPNTPGRAPCNSSSPRSIGACTGLGGREVRLPWTTDISLPPSPWVRAEARDRAVEIYWDDRSEHTPDELDGELDFEAYRVWQAPDWSRPAGSSEETGPPVNSWSMRAQFDLIDYFEPEGDAQPEPFGANTGIEHLVYRPVCLDDPYFDGLAEAMELVVLADTEGRYTSRPRLRDGVGEPIEELRGLLPWEQYPTVLDTFFAVTERPATAGVPKRSVRYYRYRDEHVHNGFLYFYAVTAIDHERSVDGEWAVAPGAGRLPSGSFVVAVPRVAALAADDRRKVYVYPNPATPRSLAEFQQMAPARDDPTGVRVAFANLPACPCTIRIFTLAGDLVETIEHEGTHGDGQASWNLMSRNKQEVTSGIYLFVVEPWDRGFERTTGKFVVIR